MVIRLSTKEKVYLETEAMKDGRTVSDYVRRVLFPKPETKARKR